MFLIFDSNFKTKRIYGHAERIVKPATPGDRGYLGADAPKITLICDWDGAPP